MSQTHTDLETPQDDHEELMETGIETMNAWQSRHLSGNDFAIALRDIGSGHESISYFPNRREALQFVGSYMHAVYGNFEDEDIRSLWTICNNAEHNKISMIEAREAINKATDQCVEIQWWGTHAELMTSNDSFPMHLRSTWRQRDKSILSQPVSSIEACHFNTYLTEEYNAE